MEEKKYKNQKIKKKNKITYKEKFEETKRTVYIYNIYILIYKLFSMNLFKNVNNFKWTILLVSSQCYN